MAKAANTIQVNSGMRDGAKVLLGQMAEFSISPSIDRIKVTVPTDLLAAQEVNEGRSTMGHDHA
jgi:hypothetical protein